MSDDLTGRRALVTGAASGIGRAVVQHFVAAGARVVVTDVARDALETVAEQTSTIAAVADLRDLAAIDSLVAAAGRALDGLDTVVNCAGVITHAPLAELDPETWHLALDVNLTAPYALCRAALPWLRQSSGSSVVNVASGMGLLPDAPGASAYAASKGGLIALTRALAAELAPTIRVNAVAPGLTDTPMTTHLLQDDGGKIPDAVRRYALQRAAAPSEIASAIAFLASDAASFITGATLAVDGGRTFH
ncbi:MAG TPA: SDR family NAD(P)-dependent oxidoreductase [Nocardioides sp.]